MSSPIVAGVAALVWSQNTGATSAAVRAKAESSADQIGGTGTLWAHGRVNADKAVR
jgi:thermitase